MKRCLFVLLMLLTLAALCVGCRRPQSYLPPADETGGAADSSDETLAPADTDPSGETRAPADTDAPGETLPVSETDPAGETRAPDTPDADPLSHGINPYAGLTADELCAQFREEASFYYMDPAAQSISTPYYLVFSYERGGKAFDKRTGEVVTLCREPGCEHTNCAFSCNTKGVAVSENRIYAVFKPITGAPVLASFDYDFNDVRLEYSWEYSDTEAPNSIYYYDGRLYYSVHAVDEEATAEKGTLTYSNVLFTFDVTTGVLERYVPDDPRITDFFMGVCGSYLYYQPQTEDYMRRLNLATGEDTLLVPSDILDREAGEIAIILESVRANDPRVSLAVMSEKDGHYSFTRCLYDTETNERLPSALYAYDGYELFWADHTDESFKNDPEYLYYLNNEESHGAENRTGGVIMYRPLAGGEAHALCRFTTDGVPDNLDTSWRILEDHILYVEYRNYLGYANEHNPDFGSDLRDYMTGKKPTPVTKGFMLIDLETHTVFTSGPEHEIAWFPED